jgi:hypothetical protein
MLKMRAGAVGGFGTDTDGMAMFMPPRAGSSVHTHYNDAFPMSSAGTRTWNYDKDGVAHYGMLPDFLVDVRSAPASGPGTLTGAQLIENSLMLGADYFLQTWKKCEQLKSQVPAN